MTPTPKSGVTTLNPIIEAYACEVGR